MDQQEYCVQLGLRSSAAATEMNGRWSCVKECYNRNSNMEINLRVI